ncbi:hypothetical protein FHX81_0557 [Saccharothrix saharensis]|uniref:PPE family protein n=1 Tax=Saccharothrix saharensis TaxID=571190 RepID=A0A543J627_9PSEU|nr:hypothetical protein [Saccharothrix saharensis]TQM78295.1 hypothetical protein FHX81_0557 [Saccharothrix saharensis]
MSGEEPASTGAVNWEAYSHEELYRMLWEDADVADVGTVAAEWAEHRAALDAHARALRDERAALLDGWHGAAAQEAADRLAALAARVDGLAEVAHAGQVAAQDAADALARARAVMPPPPGRPAGDQGTAAQSAFGFAPPPVTLPSAPPALAPPAAPPVTVPAMTAFPIGQALPTMSPSSFSSSSSIQNHGSMSTPTGTSGMGAAFGAVGGAAFSFYFGAAGVGQRKAEAVRAMQTYESSLAGGGKLLDEARDAVPPSSRTTPRADGPAAGGVPAGPSAGGRGGVPWTRLLAGGGSGVGPVPGGSAPATGHGVPLAPGPRAGVLPGPAGVLGVPNPVTADAPVPKGAAQAAMAAPVGGRADGRDDEPHENRMPTADHGVFEVDDSGSPAVIGLVTGAQP